MQHACAIFCDISLKILPVESIHIAIAITKIVLANALSIVIVCGSAAVSVVQRCRWCSGVGGAAVSAAVLDVWHTLMTLISSAYIWI